jgi:hypothetical protein
MEHINDSSIFSGTNSSTENMTTGHQWSWNQSNFENVLRDNSTK